MQPAIRFEDVSKRFAMSTEQPRTVLETIIATFRGQRLRRRDDTLWAVRNLSFDLLPGRALGIIGRNGSGKSTVLKLIARILRPTEGKVMVGGRVSALLELGAGFHQDLTGRENIYLNGSILGLSKAEIDRHFDDIVDFSELEGFIDVPVKHYSSGMYVRLAFSIAIHVRPDILILDEILAVGDQAFQTKCVERVHALKREGTTILLVTHNIDMVRNLCSELMWIEHGRLRSAGPVHTVAAQYMAEAYGRAPGAASQAHEEFQRWGSREIEITGVHFHDAAGAPCRDFRTNEPLTVAIDFVAHEAIPAPEFGLGFYRQDGVHVSGPNNMAAGVDMGIVHGPGTIRYTVERLPLLPGRYLVTAAVHDSRLPRAYDHHEQAYAFRVVPGGTGEIHGLLQMPAGWSYEMADPGDSGAAASARPDGEKHVANKYQ
jgi:lipopolysaccharide transport system ATP-binding protein